jgi:hypothetical protein
MMPSEFNYTTGMLIELGRMAVQDTDVLDYLAELSESVLQSDSLDNDLRADLDMILQEVKQAMKLLDQVGIIGLTSDEDEWNDVSDAFDTLDLLVYLIEGIEYIINQNNVRITEDIHNRLETAYGEASEMFFSPDYSTLRLATFNERRQDSLAGILPEYHYLFPWQLLQNDEKCSILSTLAEYSHELHASEKLPEAIVQNLIFYLGEIQKDKILSRFLQEEKQISMMVKETLTNHWAFRLWRAAQSEGCNRLLPKEVEQKGIGLVSRAVLKQHGLSEQDRLALAVSAACYAPGIEDSERMALLFQCEEKLKTEWRKYDAKTASGRLIEKLLFLETGRASASDVAVSAIEIWFQQLNSMVPVSVRSEEAMSSLAGAILAPVVAFAPIKEEFVNPLAVSKVLNMVDKVKSWSEFLIMDLGMVVFSSALARSADEEVKPRHVENGVLLSTNDYFQLCFKSSEDVYGYILHQNSQGKINKYFEGKLNAEQIYHFPEGNVKACLTGQPGTEIFYLVTSKTILDNFDAITLSITSSGSLFAEEFRDVLSKTFTSIFITSFHYKFK